MKRMLILLVFVFAASGLFAGVVAVANDWATIFYNGKEKVAEWKVNEDGSISKEGSSVSGLIKVYYGSKNERRYAEIRYNNNEIEDGIYSWKYKTGEDAGFETYKDGKLNGPFKYLYKNENTSREGGYENGIKQGEFKWYYKNGNPAETGMYENGKKEGLYKLFYESGQLKEKFSYESGKRQGKYIQYYKTGALKSEGQFKDGAKHGPFIFYFESGEEMETKVYNNGRLISGEGDLEGGNEEEFIPEMPVE